MEINDIKISNDGAVLISILSVLLTAPLLGVMISTIIFQCVYFFIRMKIYFTLPKNREIEDWILDEFNFRNEKIQQIKALREEGRSDYLYEYFPYYQIKVRQCVKGESLSYLERKLSVFYVHLNILGSMGLSFICALTYSASTMIHSDWDFSYYKIGGTVILIVYSIGARQIMSSSFYHATEFEHLILERAFQKTKKPAKTP